MGRRRALNAMDTSILNRLKACADHGLPCPSNGDLCAAIGLASTGSAVRILNKLQDMGLIVIDRAATSRVVQIVETGKRTAGSVEKPHWRFRDPDAVNRSYPARPTSRPEPQRTIAEPQRVDRTHCFRCGVRADIGCEHQRSK